MALAPGTRLGSYEILRKIGAGGMGEVYRAKDPKLGREVAIKVLSAGFAEDAERLRRFQQEARAASALNHPNILTVHDLGEHQGAPFLVMELLEGLTLREAMNPGPMAPERVAELGEQAAAGLAAAHERGIVHRDLKPENLFITRDGVLKILDFGLAKQSLLDGHDSTAAMGPATASGVVMGTISYMSPEQATGKPVDFRSDQFSFGVVLYELLSGRRPFAGESAAETLAAIVRDDPAPLADLSPGVPPSLAAIVQRCLAKDPAGRFESTRELSQLLKSSSRNTAGTAATGLQPVRLAGRPKTTKRLALAASLLAVILAATGLTVWKPWLSPAITSIAVLPLANRSGDADQDFFAAGMTDALIADLGQIKALKVISRTSVDRYAKERRSLKEVAGELGVQSILEGSVLRAGNRVRITAQLIDAREDRQLWSGNYERELTDVLALQREVVREIAAQIRVQVTVQEQGRLKAARKVDPATHDLVLKARALLEYAINEQDQRRAIAMFRTATEHSPEHAPAWAGLAEATWQLAMGGFEYVAPADVRDQASAAAERALALDPDLPEAHNARAIIAIDGDWDLEKAKLHFEKALELRPGFANCRHTYGQVLLWGFQRYAEARKQFEKAQELDPFSPWNGLNLLWWHTEQAQHAQALAEGARLWDQSAKNNWLIPSQMALSCLALGQSAEAVRQYEKGIAISGERNPFLVAPLGMAYGLAGRRKEAERILAELEDLSRKRYVSPQYPAMVLYGLGRQDEGYRMMEQAFALKATALVMLAGPSEHQPAFRKDPRFPAFRERVRRAIRMPNGSVAGVGP